MTTITTYGEVNGVEMDLVVEYDHQREEVDTRASFMLTITSATAQGEDKLEQMSKYEVEQLLMRVVDEHHEGERK